MMAYCSVRHLPFSIGVKRPLAYLKRSLTSNTPINTIQRWSLRSLADMGIPNRNGKVVLSSDDARRLLQDVSLRLKRQEGICRQIMDCIDAIERGDGDPKERKVPPAIKPATSARRVIRAVNQPIVGMDWRRALQLREQAYRVHKKAKQQVHNLMVLHVDTHQLTRTLLENGSVIERFSPADRHLLAATMEQVRSRHASTVETLADVVIELRDIHSTSSLDAILDIFLRGRMGIQLLCDHYVALNKGKRYGGVAVDCSLTDVLEDAMTEAKHVCDAHLQTVPEVVSSVPADATVTLIRPWVHHVLVELLKNAMASNVEAASDQTHPPSISIEYEHDSEIAALHIIDQGVGLRDQAAVQRAFGFARSSANRRWDRLEEQQSYAMVRSPLQSLGVGLPLSRIMMRHFEGDVVLKNNDGTTGGCIATIRLRRDESCLEALLYDDDNENNEDVVEEKQEARAI